MLLLPAGSCQAQAPSLSALWPFAAPRGTAIEANLEGANLAEMSLWISGRGVSAAQLGGDASKVRVRFDIALDAALGPREVRVITPKGASNPVYLWVDVLPGIAEHEPNDRPGAEMALTALPVAVDARFGAQADVDCYLFEARAGDTVVAEACAGRVFSAADVLLELQDAAGRPLAQALEGYARDPRIVHAIAKDGRYRLVVRDALYRGGPGFVYRVTIGKLPLVECLDPPGGRRGEILQARLVGVNLGATTTLSLPLPADMPLNRPVWFSAETSSGPLRPFQVIADDNPQAPHDPGSSSTTVARLPVTISGRFSAPREEHRYTLNLTDTRPVQLRGYSRTFGAAATLLMRVHGPEGNEIANTEEQTGRDPVLRFSPPRSGTYQVVVRNASSQQRPDYAYRIAIEPDGRPDFVLTVSPDVIAVQRGQTVGLTVTLERRGGFSGTVSVRAEGLSAELTSGALVLGPGNNTATLTLSSGTDAPQGVHRLRVTGEADLGAGTPGIRLAEVVGTYPRPGEGQPAPRPVEFQAVSVVEGVPLYTLSAEPAELSLQPGGTATLRVLARRKPDDNAAKAAIALEVRHLPPGVTVEAAAIPEGQTETILKFAAAANAPSGSQSIAIQGKLGENLQLAPGVILHVRR